MKLVKQTKGGWQYLLNQTEADLLTNLLNRFPFTGSVPAKISRTGKDPKTAERERLLNKSLAEHRKELEQQAAKLLAAGKIRNTAKGRLLVLNPEEREILLQILNDIRVGCWFALGQPEILELQRPDRSARDLARHGLMNLAGYFQHHLISEE